MLIAAIIACTLLIIICLGGGWRLAKILLGAVATIGLFVVAFGTDVGVIPAVVVAATIIVFGMLMARSRQERRS